MNANTQDGAGVGTAAQLIGELLSAMMVSRRAVLPKSANSATVPCSDRRAAHVRSEMQGTRSRHWEGIMALDFCDLADGVPVEMVVAVHERAIAAIRARAPIVRLDRPLGAYQVAEMKLEHPLNVTQRALDVNPESPEAHEAVAQQGRRYLAVLRELIAYCDHKTVVLRGTPRRVYGARAAGKIALHS